MNNFVATYVDWKGAFEYQCTDCKLCGVVAGCAKRKHSTAGVLAGSITRKRSTVSV